MARNKQQVYTISRKTIGAKCVEGKGRERKEGKVGKKEFKGSFEKNN